MAKSAREAANEDENRNARTQLESLVVVGSSAGGIEALSTLVSTLPADFPAPLVLAQHLDPSHSSHLAEILTARSTLPVRTVVHEEVLKPGTVYVVPANRHVEITDHEVRLIQDNAKRPKPSVDLLLSSAAQVFGERLVAVILTGTGSDGASGAHAVKAAGGTVIIENPDTASYSGMPASLAPTTVDLVADLAQIGPLLYDLVTGNASTMRPDADGPLQTILEAVRERNGIDFSRYKRPTIERRLQRRLHATGHAQLTDYLHYLRGHPAEYERLTASFLVKVTEFFRDPELFAELRERVVPELIAWARTHGRELRIWSAGCATGEEAYSLAILVAEALNDELEDFNVQIFATDLDEAAVAFARHGIYPAASVASLPPELIARYFTRLDGTYEVTKLLRGQIIFGQHDLGQRAPFPRIDLVLCRNVLIYFVPELQHRALQLFAFALRDGGYLALGKAENIKPLEALFVPAHPHIKLFQRRGERVVGPISQTDIVPDYKGAITPPTPARTRRASQPPASSPTVTDMSLARRGARVGNENLGKVMMELAVGVVVVDREYDIQSINRAALRLFGIFKEALGKDLIHLTTSIPSTALRAAIDAVFQGQVSPQAGSQTTTMVATVLGERRQLQISCYPRIGNAERTNGSDEAENAPARVAEVLLLVNDVSGQPQEPQPTPQESARAEADREISQARSESELERAYRDRVEEYADLRVQTEEMAAVNRALLEANQELLEANAGLRSANEELLVSHEEADAAAEEVKTLNEELQASNEELVTLNEEMEATVEELHAANDDLQSRSRELQELAASEVKQRQISEAGRARLEAILLSMRDAVLVVDASGAPLLINQAYTAFFGDPATEPAAQDMEGHPLPRRDMPSQCAARGEDFIMEFMLTADDDSRRYFEASGQPIRDKEGDSHGGVVVIRDITERSLFRLQDQFMAQVGHELRTPLTSQYTVLQLLARRLRATGPDEQINHYIELALEAARRVRSLVDDLMDIARLRSGKFTLIRKPVDVVAVARRVVENAQSMTEGQTIELDAPDGPLMVLGDITRLEQIVMNLLSNAIKYAPGTKRIDVRLRQVDASVELQVHDAGIGIARDDLPRVFNRLFQSSRARDLAPSGLGLGLYLTHDLVEAHDGTIEVDSEEGHGTTFTARLPLAPAEGSRR